MILAGLAIACALTAAIVTSILQTTEARRYEDLALATAVGADDVPPLQEPDGAGSGGLAASGTSASALDSRGEVDAARQDATRGGQGGLGADDGVWARRSVPEGACAWLEVDGVGIDLPVAMGLEGNPDYYLRHDLWGNGSIMGCPFTDWRCLGPAARHVLVYGHNVSGTDYMFSPIRHAGVQRNFDEIGLLRWTTSSGTSVFVPLMAMTVEDSYQPIQQFEFADAGEVRRWLVGLLPDASASTRNATKVIAATDQVISLVTCASDLGGQPWRTIVVFARLAPI